MYLLIKLTLTLYFHEKDTFFTVKRIEINHKDSAQKVYQKGILLYGDLCL